MFGWLLPKRKRSRSSKRGKKKKASNLNNWTAGRAYYARTHANPYASYYGLPRTRSRSPSRNNARRNNNARNQVSYGMMPSEPFNHTRLMTHQWLGRMRR
jgi:hypothetical protein